MTRIAIALAFWGALPLSAAPSASDLARLVTQIAVDPEACYRVTELNFSKEDLHIYLTSGYLSFAKPINGTRIAAIFTSEVEAGDGELLLIPPYRGERLSLVNFTGSPTLNEHFKATIMIFTDGTATELEAALASKSARRSAEMGAILADTYTSTLRNLTESFLVRVVHDLLSADAKSGMFYMGVAGRKLGNFDVMYDPLATADITVGELSWRDTRSYFDTWTSFPTKKKREGPPPQHAMPFVLDDYHIDASIQPDLSLSAITRATLVAKTSVGRALPFWISRQMRVTEAKVDGVPVEVFQRDSLRATLMLGGDTEEFLLVLPTGLDAAKPHQIEIHHEGAVIGKAGRHVYYITARATWYPRLGSGFAQFEMTFRYPKNLVLVTTGDLVSERTEGESRVSQFHSSPPLRFAGFNLGEYDCKTRERDGYKIDVCANREIELGLKQPAAAAPSPILRSEALRRPRNPIDPDTAAPPFPPDPEARLESLANDVSAALEFMASQFGPPPARHLSVSPIPASFGQGFLGLIYLSTLSYMDPTQRPAGARSPFSQMFFSEIMDAHEVAHQWWGNLVASEGSADEWLMEALADYSALMFLEKKKGPRALETVLERYRAHLLEKTDAGRTLESRGPITWGLRLLSSQSPESWRAITYEKGAWIMHMLRRRLGDERFSSMLRDMCEKYRFRTISTEEFREQLARFATAKTPDPDFRIFFDTWVYGTGIPAVKLTHSIRGNKITGTLTATGAGDDFTGFLPVELQQGRRKTLYWLHVSSDGSPFSIPLRQPVASAKIAVSSGDCLIVK